MAAPVICLDSEPRFYTWFLVGRSAGPGTTEITDFHPLSDAGVIAGIATVRIAHPELSPVGYYRTHREPTLRLNKEDLNLARALFSDPRCALLFIHAASGAPAGASFFFRDEDR